MKKTYLAVCALLVLMLTGSAFGAGFWLPELPGTSALGMGLSFVGKADDPTALYYNPAGIGQLDGTQVYLNGTLISYEVGVNLYDASFQETGNVEIDDREIFPYFGITSDFGLDRLTFGLAAYGVFGLAFDYPDDGPQRYLTQGVDLRTYFFNPTVAYDISDALTMALGIKIARMDITMERAIDGSGYQMRDYDIDTEISGSAMDYGFDLSLLYKVSDTFQLGLVYDSKIAFCSDDVDFEVDFPATIPYPDTTINGETELSLPASLRAGAMYQATEKLALTFEIDWMQWDVWDTVTVELDEPVIPGDPTTKEFVLRRYWNNSFSYRLGSEYQVNDALCLRGGFMYDETAIDDEYLEPNVPGTDKWALSAGLAYTWNKLTVDLAYMHFFPDDRDIKTSMQDPSANGKYTSAFDFLGLGIKYIF